MLGAVCRTAIHRARHFSFFRAISGKAFKAPEERSAIALSFPDPVALQMRRQAWSQRAFNPLVQEVATNTFNYPTTLLLSLLCEFSHKTILPQEPSPDKQDINVFFGNGVGLGSLIQLVFTLAQSIDPTVYNLKLVSKPHLLKLENWEKETKLLAIPGGNAASMLSDFEDGERSRFRQRTIDYVIGGGQYFGACAGGAMGAQSILIHHDPRRQYYWPGAHFGFYPGFAVQHVSGLDPKVVEIVYATERKRKSRRAGETYDDFRVAYKEGIAFLHRTALPDMYKNNQEILQGALRLAEQDDLASYRQKVRTLAYYAAPPGTAPAMVSVDLGDSGRATLTGMHIETQATAPNLQAYAKDSQSVLQHKASARQILQSESLRNVGLFRDLLMREHGICVSPTTEFQI